MVSLISTNADTGKFIVIVILFSLVFFYNTPLYVFSKNPVFFRKFITFSTSHFFPIRSSILLGDIVLFSAAALKQCLMASLWFLHSALLHTAPIKLTLSAMYYIYVSSNISITSLPFSLHNLLPATILYRSEYYTFLNCQISESTPGGNV